MTQYTPNKPGNFGKGFPNDPNNVPEKENLGRLNTLSAGPAVTPDIDRHLDQLLRAAGSGLRRYTNRIVINAMRKAMTEAMGAGWQPIETAPLNGTKVDLWVRPLDAAANGNAGRIADAWHESGRWMRFVGGWPHNVAQCGVPTHWCPLLPPPTEEGK